MEYLFSVIHESVVKSKSLQLRRFTLLEMKRRSGEQFTSTLCWIDDAEEDCNISSYTIEDFQLHFRLHMCDDIKLKGSLSWERNLDSSILTPSSLKVLESQA